MFLTRLLTAESKSWPFRRWGWRDPFRSLFIVSISHLFKPGDVLGMPPDDKTSPRPLAPFFFLPLCSLVWTDTRIHLYMKPGDVPRMSPGDHRRTSLNPSASCTLLEACVHAILSLPTNRSCIANFYYGGPYSIPGTR